MIKGESCLAALGRYDQAQKVLTDAAVASDPTIMLLRAAPWLLIREKQKTPWRLSSRSSIKIPIGSRRFYVGLYKEQTWRYQRHAIAAYQWFIDEPQNYLQKVARP